MEQSEHIMSCLLSSTFTRTHAHTPTHTHTVTVIHFALFLLSVSFALLLLQTQMHFPSPPFLLTSVFSWEFISYSIQSGLFTPCYDNGRELSMFNEWLEAAYRFRNILVTVNMRSSSIICSHITVFQRSSAKCAHTEAQIYFGRVSAHLHTVCIVQMSVSLNKLCTETPRVLVHLTVEGKAEL